MAGDILRLRTIAREYFQAWFSGMERNVVQTALNVTIILTMFVLGMVREY